MCKIQQSFHLDSIHSIAYNILNDTISVHFAKRVQETFLASDKIILEIQCTFLGTSTLRLQAKIVYCRTFFYFTVVTKNLSPCDMIVEKYQNKYFCLIVAFIRTQDGYISLLVL